MSIASAITAAQGRVSDAYTAISNKGGTLPATHNLANMPTAINSIPSGSGADTVTATNYSSSAVSNGDKVWLKKNGSTYTIKDVPFSANVGYLKQGSPTISDNVVSNFSGSSYVQSSVIMPTSFSSYELKIKIHTSSIGTTQFIISDTQIYSGNVIGINESGKIIWYASSGSQGGYTWNILNGVTGNTTLLANTDYWAKFVFTGTHYICYLSQTGEFEGEETTEIDVTSSVKIAGGYVISYGVQITTSQGTYNPFCGSIDMKETTIKIDGQNTWSGANPSINYANIYSGIAQESISVGSSGDVKTVLS